MLTLPMTGLDTPPPTQSRVVLEQSLTQQKHTHVAGQFGNRTVRFQRSVSDSFEVTVVEINLPAPRRVQRAQRFQEHFNRNE